jgi:hypothetical protein
MERKSTDFRNWLLELELNVRAYRANKFSSASLRKCLSEIAMDLRFYKTTEHNMARFWKCISELAMELRLCRPTERNSEISESAFQNLQRNNVYIELANVKE